MVGDRLVLLVMGIWTVGYMVLGVTEPVTKPNTSLLESVEERDNEEDETGEVNEGDQKPEGDKSCDGWRSPVAW